MGNVVAFETPSLANRAERIRALMQDMVRNTLALGRELADARADSESFPIGPRNKIMGWKKWLRSELNLSENHAQILIRIYRKFGQLVDRGQKLPNIQVLRLLLPPTVPQSARQEILDRADKGEKIGRKTAKGIVKRHLPSPKQAIEKARETGRPVEASDGFVYLGSSENELREQAQRRNTVYSVREAIACLAKQELPPRQFLEYALPHQLWKSRNEHEIGAALRWLTALAKAWEGHGQH